VEKQYRKFFWHGAELKGMLKIEMGYE